MLHNTLLYMRSKKYRMNIHALTTSSTTILIAATSPAPRVAIR